MIVSTLLILSILKIKRPIVAFDFRPINLCNNIYKLVSKVLANWLKQILPILMSKSQSAFMLDRIITDNIIVAYEALNSMKTRQIDLGW